MDTYTGKSIFNGIAIGRILFYKKGEQAVTRVKVQDVEAEVTRYENAKQCAMKQLRENGYIQMDKENYITLTDQGMEIAGKIYNRHKVITRFLMQLGVDEETAREDACKIEHDISPATFTAILKNMR